MPKGKKKEWWLECDGRGVLGKWGSNSSNSTAPSGVVQKEGEMFKCGKRMWIGLALAVLFLLPGLASGAGKPEQTKVRIGSSKDLQLGAQIGYAKASGWFKEKGLNVTLALFTSGAEMTSALAAGALKIGSFGDGPTANMLGGRLPIKIIAAQAEISGTQQVVVRKGIKHPKDLIGKKVGLTVGSSAQPLFLSMLNHFGVDNKKVNILNMRAPEQVAAFVRGDIDGLAVWQPHVRAAKLKGKGHALISAVESFIPGAKGKVDFYSAYSIMSARNEFINCCPNTIVTILSVLNRATKVLQDRNNWDEASKKLVRDFERPADELKIYLNQNRYDMSIDKRMVKTLQTTINFLESKGKLKSKPNVNDFLEPKFLKQVNPALVSY